MTSVLGGPDTLVAQVERLLQADPNVGGCRMETQQAIVDLVWNAALAAAGWQDIETAPKDTWVLVYMPGDDDHMGRIHAARHNTIANGFLWVIGHHFVHDLHPPTHWCPLPAPPPFDTGSCTAPDGAV